MSGYVKLHRDLFDHPIVGFHVPAPRAAKGKRPVPPMMAWQWLFSKAAYKSHSVGNKGMDVKLERGQVLAARHHLAAAWQWSEQNVRTFLKNLHAHGMVEINQSNGHYVSVVTICNYERFQSVDDAVNQSTNQSLTRESPETNHTEEKKEGKERKEKKDSSDLFDEVADAFEAYNRTAASCGLPSASKLTADRKTKIKARLKDYGVDGWKQALANIERSGFLTGQNDRGWKADLDFLVSPKSFGKIHDGGFGNGRHRSATAEAKASGKSLFELVGRDGVRL